MSDVNSPDFWQSIYEKHDNGWDLGAPTPVFINLLSEDRFVPGKMIVLGAGHGHDARLYARAGFDVTAVDFALQAVEAMRLREEPDAPVEILQADIFALPESYDGKFDYLLEYTCFCAIDPLRHEEYADLVERLLKPEAHYIALVFPIEDRPGGPPYTVSPDELEALFTTRGFDILERGVSPHTINPRRGREELLIFRKGK